MSACYIKPKYGNRHWSELSWLERIEVWVLFIPAALLFGLLDIGAWIFHSTERDGAN